MRQLLITFIFLASPTLADVTGPDGRVVECFCTDRTGERVDLGETVCLRVDGRSFMAECQMSQNNPTWREVAKGCFDNSLPQS